MNLDNIQRQPLVMGSIRECLREKYIKAHNPNGWIIGVEVEAHLIESLEHELVQDVGERGLRAMDKNIMGLPYMVDTKQVDRIEIIE